MLFSILRNSTHLVLSLRILTLYPSTYQQVAVSRRQFTRKNETVFCEIFTTTLQMSGEMHLNESYHASHFTMFRSGLDCVPESASVIPRNDDVVRAIRHGGRVPRLALLLLRYARLVKIPLNSCERLATISCLADADPAFCVYYKTIPVNTGLRSLTLISFAIHLRVTLANNKNCFLYRIHYVDILRTIGHLILFHINWRPSIPL